MKPRSLTFIFLVIQSLSYTDSAAQSKPLWQSKEYAVYADSIVQQKYTARAISGTQLISNYQSPANEFKSSLLSFKFSINGKDNEMLSGTDHHYNCDTKNLVCETPLIKFGVPLKEQDRTPGFLKPGAQLKVRLDMRHVLDEFNKKGYFTTFDGARIYKTDFKGVYIAGNSAPLIWDFDNLVNHPDLRLMDTDGDGIYEITLLLNRKEDEKQTLSHWTMSKDISGYPQYQSPYAISDALYNLSLEEMSNAIEPDSTFRTGKEWAGVWTRDVSYSIILSMAYLQPQVARYSLLRKVSKKRKIIQDTGTGGAWPVSTDRLIWAIAAWELYKVTGDHDWLKESYTIIKNSIDDDRQNIYDRETGLVKGESSFLDWREQTYPRWMQPADIFESENLGTNAVHYKANRVLAEMAGILNEQDNAKKYNAIAEQIKKGINQYLWLPAQGYYGQYLYGRTYKMISPRAEALGEALCVLFDIAGEDRQLQIVSHAPVTPFGITCIYPQIPNIPPYHNNAIWPFVQAYWMLASAKQKNETAVMESIAAIYRPSAMFATNKENFVAENGDHSGTQINSSNMLWSLSGNISIVHKVLFGIDFEKDGLVFHPFVPEALKGKRTLTHFRYREAVLDIDMDGFGDKIRSFKLDGRELGKAELSATLKGSHHVEIILADQTTNAGPINKVPVLFTPAAPVAVYKNNILSWPVVNGAVRYKLFRNGKLLREMTGTRISVREEDFCEYQMIAIGKDGLESFASEPVMIVSPSHVATYEAENYANAAAYPYKGYTARGFIETDVSVNTSIEVPITIKEDGNYLIDIRYSNGNGPSNTDNKCAVRTVLVDDTMAGTLVFPQRGKEEWSNWGFTNRVSARLSKGPHVLKLQYLPANENMNELTNQAMIDYFRVIKD